MEHLLFAAIADDDTGASDLAGMLADQDVRTLLVIDLPEPERFFQWSHGSHAVVMAEGTRSVEPSVAYQRTRDAIRLLQSQQPRMFQVKYCSTFDSTPAGNIGPTIDAALDELREDFTIALPALPVNGRTTYMGYHFVHRQLLSDSPMRHHPLTPMANPNLVDLLARQTKRRVGLASYPVVAAGAERLREHFQELRRQGIAIAIVDCLNDEHLVSICSAVADMRLITGSSAPGMKLPAIWRRQGWLDHSAEGWQAVPQATHRKGCLLVAGSCSVATRRQNEWLAAQGVTLVRLDPRDVVTPGMAMPNEVSRELAAGRHCLLTTSDAPEQVHEAQAWAAGQGLSVDALGLAIVRGLAELARQVLERHDVGGLVVAGGETSGALCRRLELGALRVGRNIEPGVPLCLSLGHFRLPVVLKSGNFGGPDFYEKALKAVTRPEEYYAGLVRSEEQ